MSREYCPCGRGFVADQGKCYFCLTGVQSQNAPKPNKYHAQKCVVQGEIFDSRREGKRYFDLWMSQQRHQVRNLRRQVEYPIVVNGVLVCKYVADFCYDVKEREGDENVWVSVVEDCKGVRTPAYRLKKKLMKVVLGIEVRES